ncbi:MAG: cytochrome c biogenesis protein CcdA, partial [Candidatus Woesearchaeota archaeon]|nr:cytochrome c biogenesis protein CcdA [Candidatus Woesearchaeota archaeon]
MVEVTIIAAFIAGIVSFLSPCVLPLIPGFLAYLAGTQSSKTKLFITSVFFVLGFSTVFALLGVLLNTILLQVSQSVQAWLSKIAGLIIIIFGLYIVGLLKINFLEKDHKILIKKRFQVTYLTAFVFGAAFAVGWT